MNLKKIRIIHPVPSFVDPIRFIHIEAMDKGTTIELPEPVANLLIRKNRAKEVIVENQFLQWQK
ncbi:MAG: hypothetical protein Q7S55_04560 [Nanoarchaeota archaeon]|nr:hypothetical protein [Nanoarchaeota archaeon]